MKGRFVIFTSRGLDAMRTVLLKMLEPSEEAKRLSNRLAWAYPSKPVFIDGDVLPTFELVISAADDLIDNEDAAVSLANEK